MSTCREFKEKFLDFIEGNLKGEEYTRFEKHLGHCKQCQNEYISVKRLYEVLNQDEVLLPELKFFDDLKVKIRQREIAPRWVAIKKIMRIFVPVCAAAALVLVLLNRPTPTVEITIPTSNLLEDRDIAGLSLGGIIDDELIHEMSVVEDYLASGYEETIDELTEEEQSTFIEILYTKYDNGM